MARLLKPGTFAARWDRILAPTTGWLGGELVYVERVGVEEEEGRRAKGRRAA
jgi:hypothetical protein